MTPTRFQKSEGGQKVKIEPKGRRVVTQYIPPPYIYIYPGRNRKRRVFRSPRPEEKYIVKLMLKYARCRR